jgi:hypothetical protein
LCGKKGWLNDKILDSKLKDSRFESSQLRASKKEGSVAEVSDPPERKVKGSQASECGVKIICASVRRGRAVNVTWLNDKTR